jgi:hypothetical protein
MAKEDILAVVPKETQDRIKAIDPNPVYRAYAVAHEGQAKGTIIGFGATLKRYVTSAISKIYEKLKAGTQIFFGHGPDNTHEGRISIGEVVGKKIEQWKNKLTAFAVMYIYPDYRDMPLDVASIEADLLIDPRNPDEIAGVNVNDITGIALGNSAAGWMPGFEGAEMIAELQAFASQAQQGGVVDNKITIDEIRTVIKEGKLQPSDIFAAEDITADPVFKGNVNAMREKLAGEYAHRKRDEEGFDKTRKDLEDKINAKDAEIVGLKKSAAKAMLPALFTKIKGERKLDEKQEKFLLPRIEKFEPKETERVESEFNIFIDEGIKEFNELAEVFGVKAEKTEKKGGAETSDGSTAIANPFIPTF